MIPFVFGIEIKDGKAQPGIADLDNPRSPKPAELVEKALWTIVSMGGNVSAAHRQLREELGDEAPARETMQLWKRRTYRNRYEEIRRRKIMEIDEVLAAQATDNAIQLGAAAERALRQTLAGLAGANAVESSTILRNIAQARNVELTHSTSLKGRDGASQIGRGLEEIAKELAGLGRNIVAVEREDPSSGVLDAEVVEELPTGAES